MPASWKTRLQRRLKQLACLALYPLDRALSPTPPTRRPEPDFDALLMVYEGATPPAPALPEGFSVTRMTRGDLRAWFAVMSRCGLVSSYTLDGIARFVWSGNFRRHLTFLVWRGNELAAGASAWEARVEGHIVPLVHLVGVDPQFRRLGLGECVTALVVRHFRQTRGEQQRVWLYTDREAARRLYEKMGFRACPAQA